MIMEHVKETLGASNKMSNRNTK